MDRPQTILERLRNGPKTARKRTARALLRVPDRILWRTAVAMAAFGLISAPAAAQGISDLGTVLCDSGAWQLIALAFAAIAIYLIFKGVAGVLLAADNIKSPREGDKIKGREQLAGGGTKIAVGLFGVPVVAALFDLVGFTTFSCVDWGAVSPISAQVIVSVPV